MKGIRPYITTIIVCSTVIFLALLGAYLWLSFHGYKPDQLILYVTQVLPPVVMGVFTLLKVTAVQKDVKTVEEQTNGALVARLNAQTDELKDHVVNVVNQPQTPEVGEVKNAN